MGSGASRAALSPSTSPAPSGLRKSLGKRAPLRSPSGVVSPRGRVASTAALEKTPQGAARMQSGALGRSPLSEPRLDSPPKTGERTVPSPNGHSYRHLYGGPGQATPGRGDLLTPEKTRQPPRGRAEVASFRPPLRQPGASQGSCDAGAVGERYGVAARAVPGPGQGTGARHTAPVVLATRQAGPSPHTASLKIMSSARLVSAESPSSVRRAPQVPPGGVAGSLYLRCRSSSPQGPAQAYTARHYP